ncbi:hypothetical protein MKW98_018368 [Papaver atlanticum]|uniref:BHLH domain-containing protein n=1 Tax=Papaver atlanticum TaxID=357466 RepID=A0AAD4XPP9_9MAGN|nr:hypothetical protein MKW98_018368 [Papaver atlanticum]
MAGNITEELTTENGNSFTALLGLPPNQAVELLHEPELSQNQLIFAMKTNEDLQKGNLNQNYYTDCSSMFIRSSDLVERASRFSIFTKNDEEMSATNFVVSSNSCELKKEPIDTDSNPDSPLVFSDSSIKKRSSTKRKEREKIKAKVCGGNSKDKEISEEEADCKKLPYVHVRARRGQATDSHSLAERARREKINARMKLLQELVPGCTKITGTALVLDEIINHVQSLQRQVEFLSMKLATVNPRMDFSLESLLSLQSGGSLTASSFPSTFTSDPSLWPDLIHIMNNNSSSTTTGTRGGAEHKFQYDHDQQHQNQLLQQHHLWHPDMLQQQPPVWERDGNQSFATSPDNSVYSSYNPTNSVVFRHGVPDQLKMEI